MGLTIRPGVGSGAINHNDTLGRNDADAHAISAISELASTLTTMNQSITGKVDVTDIVNDMTTGGVDVPISAEQVKSLKATVDLLGAGLQPADIANNLTTNDPAKVLSAAMGVSLFQYANDGKTAIATAINNRGVAAAGSDSFSTLASKIGEIAPAPEVIGNATADKVLAPYTFSTATLSGVTGTMVDRGANGFTPGAAAVAIPAGYYNGSGVVAAVANLTAGNIAYNATVGGVTGTYKGLGNATAADVLATKTFSTGSLSNATGTMTNRGAVTLTPGASSVAIPAGYHNGSGVVSAVTNLVAENIKDGVVVGGVTGNVVPIPTFAYSNLAFSTAAGGGITGAGAGTLPSATSYFTDVLFSINNIGGGTTIVLTSSKTIYVKADSGGSGEGTTINAVVSGSNGTVVIFNPTRSSVSVAVSTGYPSNFYVKKFIN